MRTSMVAAAFLIGLALPACGSRASNPSDAGPDGAPDAGQPGAWSFVSGDDGSSPAVVLQADGAPRGGEVWLKVVARGVPSLQGVAFRLSFDPQRVQVLESEEGDVWALSSVKHVARFATRKEGELWAGLGHLGQGSLVAQSETTLARVKVAVKGGGEATIGFRAGHNMVLTTQGAALKSAWLGGRLSPRAN